MNRSAVLTFLLFSQLDAQSLLDLNLEDLTQIEVTDTTASFTSTNKKETPASVTVITQQDILESGARNLDELLEIYVPSFTYMNKVYGSQIGMRGIISDRNNKILLMVNNRVMNIKTSDGGAVSERWLSMLGDIKRVTVITGAGSPIYGAGAIAGVIKIETFDAQDVEGVNVSGKVGAVEEFAMAQMSYGGTVFDDTKLYFYYGLDHYSGASEDKAPHKFAFDYSGKYSWNSDIIAPADEPYPFKTTNDGASLNHQLRHKAHLQLSSDNFIFWTRFTSSSIENPTEQKRFQWLTKNNAYMFEDTGTQNQQLTIFAEYKQKIDSDLSINYDLSYQRSDIYSKAYENTTKAIGIKAWGEDNIVAKLLVNYSYDDDNIFAFGSEYNYNWYGRPSDIGFSEYSYINSEINSTKWNTDVISFFGEYQKHFNNNLTMFAGIRVDKHSYLDVIYSPRISFIYNLDNENIFKLNWNRSNRYSDEADLYLDKTSADVKNDIEEIDTFEFIYTKYIDSLTVKFAAFYNEHEVIAYDATSQETENLGKVDSYGGEIQLNYQTDNLLFNISHSYTNLKNFKLADPEITVQNISAMPYGFGDSFANWNENITKIRLNYKFTDRLTWVNSLRVFWGLEGGEDMANYNISLENSPPDLYKLPYYTDGHTRAFEESIYYNASLIYDLNRQTTFSIYGYNLLGIFNEDYNKRNFYFYSSQYRNMAPSVAFAVKYKIY
jgi:outer membrane receptor protein involved in Fe transport